MGVTKPAGRVECSAAASTLGAACFFGKQGVTSEYLFDYALIEWIRAESVIHQSVFVARLLSLV